MVKLTLDKTIIINERPLYDNSIEKLLQELAKINLIFKSPPSTKIIHNSNNKDYVLPLDTKKEGNYDLVELIKNDCFMCENYVKLILKDDTETINPSGCIDDLYQLYKLNFIFESNIEPYQTSVDVLRIIEEVYNHPSELKLTKTEIEQGKKFMAYLDKE